MVRRCVGRFLESQGRPALLERSTLGIEGALHAALQIHEVLVADVGQELAGTPRANRRLSDENELLIHPEATLHRPEEVLVGAHSHRTPEQDGDVEGPGMWPASNSSTVRTSITTGPVPAGCSWRSVGRVLS